MAESAHSIGVKFKATVRPGQPVALRFEFVEPHTNRFELSSAAQTVASGTLLISIAGERAHVR